MVKSYVILCLLAAFSQMQIGILEKIASTKFTKSASMLERQLWLWF